VAAAVLNGQRRPPLTPPPLASPATNRVM
jgi:hypothetical protein